MQHTTSHLQCTVSQLPSISHINNFYSNNPLTTSGSVIETNIGILAASIPSFKPLFKRYLPHLIGDYSSSKNRTPGLDTKRGVGTTNETSRSGFVELGDGKEASDNGDMEMGDMYSHGKKGAVNTNIAGGQYSSSFFSASNSSKDLVCLVPNPPPF